MTNADFPGLSDEERAWVGVLDGFHAMVGNSTSQRAWVTIRNTLLQALKRTERAEIERDAMQVALTPFANIVRQSNGRIPTERLSLADWHAAAKAAV